MILLGHMLIANHENDTYKCARCGKVIAQECIQAGTLTACEGTK